MIIQACKRKVRFAGNSAIEFLKLNKMNSLNLSSLELQELDTSEQKENDGGYLTLIAVGLTAIAGAYIFGKDIGRLL